MGTPHPGKANPTGATECPSRLIVLVEVPPESTACAIDCSTVAAVKPQLA